MDTIKVDCYYKEHTSKKDDSKKFKAISIRLSDDYEKLVFLTVPEQVLLEKTYKEQETINPFNNY